MGKKQQQATEAMVVNLRKHEKTHRKMVHEKVHTGEKPYTCTNCDKSFACPKKHEQIHTGEKPSTCPTKNSHNKSYDLKGHEKLHIGEKAFKCITCDKISDLKSHQNPRQICGKECDQKEHKKTHTGDENFESQCHDKIHTGENTSDCSTGNQNSKKDSCSSKASDFRPHKEENFLKLGSINVCGGLFKKEELIIETIKSNNIDIIGLLETEIHHFDTKKPFTIKGFKTYVPLEREKSSTVRLLCLVREDIEVKLREDLMSPLLCSVWLETTAKDGKKVLLSFIYREFNDLADNGKLSIPQQVERMQIFNTQIDKAYKEGLVVCMGDFNINLEKYSSPSYYLKPVAEEYQKTISNFGLSVIDFGITWKRTHLDGSVHESAIDHGLINKLVHLKTFAKREVDYSDHCMIMMEVQCGIPRNHSGEPTQSRDFRKIRANPEYLQYALSNIDWTKLAKLKDVNEMVQYWDEEIVKVLNKVAPVCERKRSSKKKHHLSQETLRQMQIRDEMREALKQFTCKTCDMAFGRHIGESTCNKCEQNLRTHTGEKSSTCNKCDKNLRTHTEEKPSTCKDCDKNFSYKIFEEKHTQYKKQRNYCNNLIKADIRRSLGENISNKSSNTDIWRAINVVLRPERMAYNKIKININDTVVEDTNVLNEKFNEFFKNKPIKLAKKIVKNERIDPLSRLKTKVAGLNLGLFTIKTATERQVSKVIKSLKAKTSCGFDGISAELLKLSGETLIAPLRYIINTSILEGKFPNKWKEAKVVPLFKKGDRSLLKNYRPVSLLSVPGMVLEKIVQDQITKFFEENGLFGDFQFGFRENKSTITELITLFESLLEAKQDNKEIALLMYDLSAAFDTVQVSIILEKLKIYGFSERAMRWIESYLTGRRQAVRLSGNTSSFVDMTIGTPQGSRLSPLLFTIIMADLNLWTNKSKLSNFADDTQSIIIADNKEELENITKEESDTVLDFFSGINLINNADKACLLYNSKGKGSQIDMDNIGGEKLQSKESEKLLGLQVSSKLDWKVHMDKLCITLRQRLGLLRRIQYKIPREKLLIIAEAIFVSKIRYGLPVYYKPRLTDEDPMCKSQDALQVLHNDMLRLIAGHRRSDRTNMKELRSKFNMMSVNQLACYHILMECRNILENNASKQVKDKMKPEKKSSRWELRSEKRGDLKIFSNPKKSCKGFSYFAAKLWNQAPEKIRNMPKPLQFKTAIKPWILKSIPN